MMQGHLSRYYEKPCSQRAPVGRISHWGHVHESPTAPTTAQSCTEDCKNFIADNPHCRQILTDAVAALGPSHKLHPLDTLRQTLVDESPRATYTRRDDRDRSLYCNSALRALLSDIHVLNQWTMASYGRPYTIVYDGAAPGHHLVHLAHMYPECKFIIYDPRSLAKDLPTNIVVHRELFTDKSATALAENIRQLDSPHVNDGGLIFISNTGEPEDDPERNRRWVTTLNPEIAVLRFNLPWRRGATTYLDGTVLLQPFASQATTGTRLVVAQGGLGRERVYDHTVYEEQMAYHNMAGRVRAYSHDIEIEGLDHCYDCSVFVSVFRAYLARACAAGRVVLDDDRAAVRCLMLDALSALETSIHRAPQRVATFVSTVSRSEARQWRAG